MWGNVHSYRVFQILYKNMYSWLTSLRRQPNLTNVVKYIFKQKITFHLGTSKDLILYVISENLKGTMILKCHFLQSTYQFSIFGFQPILEIKEINQNNKFTKNFMSAEESTYVNVIVSKGENFLC